MRFGRHRDFQAVTSRYSSTVEIVRAREGAISIGLRSDFLTSWRVSNQVDWSFPMAQTQSARSRHLSWSRLSR